MKAPEESETAGSDDKVDFAGKFANPERGVSVAEAKLSHVPDRTCESVLVYIVFLGFVIFIIDNFLLGK